uniref:Uncharacterized protein n=1 Tax=Lotharella oceanica TaxID=641309 RepID=A0A7S2U379_9EUKA
MAVPLRMTPRIQETLRLLEAKVAVLPCCPPEEEDDIRRLIRMKEAEERITFDDVRKLSKIFRKLQLESKHHNGYIHELLEDSEVSFPEEVEEDNRDPAFLRRLEQLRLKAEHEYYFGPAKVKDEGAKAGLKAFPNNKVIPVLMGAGGLVGILIVETVLIIMRDERENIQRKNKEAANKARHLGELSTSKQTLAGGKDLRRRAKGGKKKRPG